MRKLFLLPFVIAAFSCKKKSDDNNLSVLNETHWKLYYKNNNTFSFYAASEIYFKENKSIDNYRNFDTLYGEWSENSNIVIIDFNNGDSYSGTLITNDSISGTLTATGSNGVWYATKK